MIGAVIGPLHYRLATGVLDSAACRDLRRRPELFCCFRRVPGKDPTFYPVACSPQAWSGIGADAGETQI